MHPSHEINKSYLVGFDKPISSNQIQKIKNGVHLEDGKTSPAHVRIINPTVVEITIHEGKNRIIRDMASTLGLRIRFLKRVAVGKLRLGDLAEGQHRELTINERMRVFEY